MAYTPKLTYKGKPLVRCGNEIYYGNMTDPYVLYLQTMTTKVENGQEIADKIHLILLSTDIKKPLPEPSCARPTRSACTTHWTSAASGWRRRSPKRPAPERPAGPKPHKKKP